MSTGVNALGFFPARESLSSGVGGTQFSLGRSSAVVVGREEEEEEE